jgi:hypothetical protein
MKKMFMNTGVLLSIISFCTLTSCLAQDVSNIRSYEEDGKIIILYDLLSQSETKLFFIKLSFSDDDGKTFTLIPSGIDGDANTLVKKGFNHVVTWAYPTELTKNSKEYVFKVEAVLVKKETALSKSAKSGIGVQVIDVARSGADVHIIISLSNERTELQIATVSVNNVVAIDNKDKIYREVSGDIAKPFTLEDQKKYAVVFIKNIDPQIKQFTQLEFNASGIIAKYTNVAIREN